MKTKKSSLIKVAKVRFNELKKYFGKEEPLNHMVNPENTSGFIKGIDAKGQGTIYSSLWGAKKQLIKSTENPGGFERSHPDTSSSFLVGKKGLITKDTLKEQVEPYLKRNFPNNDYANSYRKTHYNRLDSLGKKNSADLKSEKSNNLIYGNLRHKYKHILGDNLPSKNWGTISSAKGDPRNNSYGDVGILTSPKHQQRGYFYKRKETAINMAGDAGVFAANESQRGIQLPKVKGKVIYNPLKVTREQAKELKSKGGIAMNGRLSRYLKALKKQNER